MGQCQFMPTNYLDAAVSYRGDGRRDIWNRREDVLASIANFLSKLGWHGDETWGREVLAPRGLDPRLIGKEVSQPLQEWRRLGVRGLDGGELPDRNITASLLMPDGTDGRAFLVYENFRTLLRWNNSTFFAISVGSFADALE
jgi:membrane-bound lytic murein transglycosylase B